MKSLRANLIYNIINTVSGLVFPLITYPYVFRILMANGVGTVNFLNSVISYVVLLTGLGIPLYGIREIARVRGDLKELTKTTLEILTLNLLLNIVGYVIILVLAFSVNEIKENVTIFLLLSSSLLLTSLGCQWFYSGTEDFKFVTIRGLIIRVLCTIFLFLVVRTKDDILWYAFYTVLISTGNYIVNFLCLRSRISISLIKPKELNIRKHIRPACAVFAFNLVTSIYLNLDKVMLGLMKGTEAVGFYTASTQISHILLTMATALGAVILPRASFLIKNKQLDEFYRLSNKSYHFILMFAIPLCIGCIVMAPMLIHIFCGESYEPSIITLRIICPIIICIGISNLIGLQMLYPLGLIKIVTISTCVGAIINVILNFILIPVLSQNGAAISTVLAEAGVTLSQIIIARKYIKIKLFTKENIGYILSAVLMGGICYFLIQIDTLDIIKLICVPLVGAFIYGTLIFLLRDPFALEVISMIKSKFKL